MAFVLSGAPCIKCAGNERLCSNEDPTLPYNSLTCDLISNWVLRMPGVIGRPNGSPNKTRRPRQLLPKGVSCCKYCQSKIIGTRGIRTNLTYSVYTVKCYNPDCSRAWSVPLK